MDNFVSIRKAFQDYANDLLTDMREVWRVHPHFILWYLYATFDVKVQLVCITANIAARWSASIAEDSKCSASNSLSIMTRLITKKTPNPIVAPTRVTSQLKSQKQQERKQDMIHLILNFGIYIVTNVGTHLETSHQHGRGKMRWNGWGSSEWRLTSYQRWTLSSSLYWRLLSWPSAHLKIFGGSYMK